VKTNSFTVSLYTYPWDLTHEGLDVSLDRIADLAACDEVLLTPCYHRSEYFLPHNPRHPVYFGENGAVYFAPDLTRYEGTRIRPRVSREVTDHDYFDRIVDAINKRGLQFAAWMVYTFQNYLSEKYPEFAKHDAFGTPYVGQLSTAPEDVRQYFLALTSEVIERYQPTAVWVESLMRRGFPMPGKKRVDIPQRCRFLLSLCFNPASIACAEADGMDAEPFRQDVVDWLRPRLANGADPASDQPATPEWIAAAFEGRLQRYLEVSCKQTTDLWLKVAKVIRSGGAKLQTDLADPFRALSNDLDPRINTRIDRLSYTLKENEDPLLQIAELEKQIAPQGTVFLRPGGDLNTVAPIREQCDLARTAGAGGVTLYNYGLLTENQLSNIGQAVRSL
jgi:hypothetical protein